MMIKLIADGCCNLNVIYTIKNTDGGNLILICHKKNIIIEQMLSMGSLLLIDGKKIPDVVARAFEHLSLSKSL